MCCHVIDIYDKTSSPWRFVWHKFYEINLRFFNGPNKNFVHRKCCRWINVNKFEYYRSDGWFNDIGTHIFYIYSMQKNFTRALRVSRIFLLCEIIPQISILFLQKKTDSKPFHTNFLLGRLGKDLFYQLFFYKFYRGRLGSVLFDEFKLRYRFSEKVLKKSMSHMILIIFKREVNSRKCMWS